jgi:hypothetical protein
MSDVPAPPPNPLAAEEEAFARLLSKLLTTHKGQYVAILGDRVVASGPDQFAVLSQAYAEQGYRPILCRLVTDQPERVVRIPSVWRVGERVPVTLPPPERVVAPIDHPSVPDDSVTAFSVPVTDGVSSDCHHRR